jgi:outer membrane protein assembly factor BamB
LPRNSLIEIRWHAGYWQPELTNPGASLFMSRLIAVTMLIAAAPGIRLSADWPGFRGPAGNGHALESRLPVSWTQSQNIAWKHALPGEGWSSPVVVGNRVWLTMAVTQGTAKPAASRQDYSLRLYGLNASTGSRVLDVEVFREEGKSAAAIHTKNSHASPTPLVDGNRIYVHFGHEGTACLDLSGKKLWENRSMRYSPVHGAGSSPILVDGALIFTCDGGEDPFIVALDADTGAVRWKVARTTDAAKTFSFCTATVLEVNGSRQVIAPGSNNVLALDPATGAELWRVRYDGYSVIPKPVVGDGLLYICTGYDRPKLLAIRLGGRGDVTDTHVAWTAGNDIPHTPSLLLVDGALYMVSDRGIASCLDAGTGKPIWQQRVGGNYSASPLYANGLIYFQSEEGTTTVIKASREYEVVATSSIDERTLASHAVSGGALFLRSDKYLYRIEQRQ